VDQTHRQRQYWRDNPRDRSKGDEDEMQRGNPRSRSNNKRVIPGVRVCACGCGRHLTGANRTVRKVYLNTAHRVRHHRAMLRQQQQELATV